MDTLLPILGALGVVGAAAFWFNQKQKSATRKGVSTQRRASEAAARVALSDLAKAKAVADTTAQERIAEAKQRLAEALQAAKRRNSAEACRRLDELVEEARVMREKLLDEL